MIDKNSPIYDELVVRANRIADRHGLEPQAILDEVQRCIEIIYNQVGRSVWTDLTREEQLEFLAGITLPFWE